MADTKAGYQVTALPGAEEIGNFEHSYLVCHLDDRLFGIPTTEVQEIVPLPQLMKLPQLPNCMLGLARYREEIIPVLNLRTISAMGDSVTHESEQMIVINHGRRLCGGDVPLRFGRADPRRRHEAGGGGVLRPRDLAAEEAARHPGPAPAGTGVVAVGAMPAS